MKYRICQKGDYAHFKIQRKGWLFWRDLGTYTGSGRLIPKYYVSYKDAILTLNAMVAEEALRRTAWIIKEVHDAS